MESLLRSIILQTYFVYGDDLTTDLLEHVRKETFKALVQRFHQLLSGKSDASYSCV